MQYSVSKNKKLIVEYVWLGLDNEIFSKTRILSARQLVQNRSSDYIDYKEIPEWDYDASSTKQATTESSEAILKPCALYKNPFIKDSQSFIVLCSTYTPDGTPLKSNTRHDATQIFSNDAVIDQDIWFGIEFEYMMFSRASGRPLTTISATPIPNAIFNNKINYCSITALGHNVVEEHMMLCLDAGIGYDGYNSEVVVGQWEYQIFGKGIDVADQSIVARYILERVAFRHGIFINWHPKPIPDKNGQGKHVNCSTKAMRSPGGISEIHAAIQRLEAAHDDHIKVYGKDNELRLTGRHETSSYKKFTSGQADRTASVRIGSRTAAAGCGYFEDRRPASNADEYLVTSKLAETILLG